MIYRVNTHQVFAALLALFLAAAPAEATGTDCSKSATRAEKARCTDPGYARDKNPPEVNALIGMRIPPIITGKKSGPVPGWTSIGGASLNNDWVHVEQMHSALNTAIVAIRRDKDRNGLILDAKALPSRLLTYDLINNKTRLRKYWYQHYSIGSQCERNNGVSVVGLMRPEPGKHDCNHESRQVIKAWQIDMKNGRIIEIQPTGVRCYFDRAEDDCSN